MAVFAFTYSIYANEYHHVSRLKKDTVPTPNYSGHIILSNNLSFISQISNKNTIYEVLSDFNLEGDSISIPAGCILSFKGGTIRNGTLVGNNTTIQNVDTSIIFSDIQLDGTWHADIACPEWFGAVGDGISDDREAIQTAINVGNIVVLNKQYLIHNAPFNYNKYRPIPEDELDYFLDVMSQKNNTPNSSLTPIIIPSNKTVIIVGGIKAYSPLGNLIELRGDNIILTGGGTISGCGIVHTVNVYTGEPSFDVIHWESALIYIKGSNNRIETLTIKDPTTQGISIDDYLSKDNIICNNTIGGGLKTHTKTIATCNFTGLFGIYARGTNTIVKDNVFKKLEDKCVYDALYCNYSTSHVPSAEKRTEIHTVFENNIVDGVLEHAVYTYASNLRITNNTIRSDMTALQLFNGNQLVDNNTIVCNHKSSGLYVSGENQVITNNKLFNVGRYGIRCAGFHNGSCDNDYVANNYIEKVMAPFSDTQPKTTPAITFESSAYQNNKVQLHGITCENNTIICKGISESARTTPIIGLIAVFGDKTTTIEHINIVNNEVINSNVADNIVITLLNAKRSGLATIERNQCINRCPIISTTPGEPILKIHGVKVAIITNNHLEQLGTKGVAFELKNVEKAEFYNNTMIADFNSQSIFFFTDKESSFYIDGSNIINGFVAEQTITIPAKTTVSTAIPFCLPHNHWNLEIIPINRAAKKAESLNPLLISSNDINSIHLYHQIATKRRTIYKIRALYK